MTVKELIAQLEKLNPDLTVGVSTFDDEDHYFGGVSVAKEEYVGSTELGEDLLFVYLYPDEENIIHTIMQKNKNWPNNLFYETGA